jgi:hypothetical protein
MSDTAKTLDDIAGGMATAAAALAGTGIPGIIASIGAIVLKSAAAFVRAGKDPVIEIQRIHDADPLLKSIHDEWDRVIREKFPPDSDPPPARDTLPAGAPSPDDPYGDG